MKVCIFIASLLLYWSFRTTAEYPRFRFKELRRSTQSSSSGAFASQFMDGSHDAQFPYHDSPQPSHLPSSPSARAFLRQSLVASLAAKHHMEDARNLASSWWHAGSVQSEENSRGSSMIFNPTANGADPTGHADSTLELQLTINQAFEVASRYNLLGGITDLGGVQVHLNGGQYAISKPLTIPEQGGGNVMIHGGTLRAMSSFPTGRFLIELGSSAMREEWLRLGGKLQSQAQPAYENIVLQNLMLDANYSAGGILLLNPIRTTIANCYITHFSSTGISVHGGHETFIHTSFLGQHITAGGDPGEKSFSGTAILLDSNDNAVTNVVIFSAETGIEVRGQANIMTGVHCYNKATGWGGVGIIVRQGARQNRMLGCYLDFTGIVLEETSQITISNGYFLGDAFVLLRAVGGNPSVFGLSIVDNMFSGSNRGVPIVQTEGSFSQVKQTCVDDNSANGMALRSTRARFSVAGFGSNWTADLSQTLLFSSSIAHVQYSFFASNQNATNGSNFFPNHAIQSITATSITVASDQPMQAIVSFNVDQSSYSDNDSKINYL